MNDQADPSDSVPWSGPSSVIPLSLPILTVGYSAFGVPNDPGADAVHRLMAAVRAHIGGGAPVIVDVRSRPYSRTYPAFNEDSLARCLGSPLPLPPWRELLGRRPSPKRAAACEFRYVSAGRDLGGWLPSGAGRDDSGKVDYEQCMLSPSFQDAVTFLIDAAARGHALILMCAEADPRVLGKKSGIDSCHRVKLIGRYIGRTYPDVPVLHYWPEKPSRLLSQEEAAEGTWPGGQPLLFDVGRARHSSNQHLESAIR